MGATGEWQGNIEFLLYQNHGHAVLAQDVQRMTDLLHDHRGQAQKRFVQQQDPRLRHQGSTDGHHLLFTAGQGTGQLLASLCQARKQGIDRIKPLLQKTTPLGQGHRAQQQIVLHRHRGEHMSTLRHLHHTQSHDGVAGQCHEVHTIEHGLPTSARHRTR